MAGLRTVLRAPLLHFVLLGAGLYLLAEQLEGPKRVKALTRIQISSEAVDELEREWWQSTGRAPNPRELDGMISQRVDDELLLASALALGWERSDPVVQRRLILNQRFLFPESDKNDADLLELAFEQGMERSDIVVRRRLIERVRLAISARAREGELGVEELEGYLRQHEAEFERPAKVRLTQLYLSRDLRRHSLEADASQLAERLRREAVEAADAKRLSDPSLLATELPLWPQSSLAARFGAEFARAAMEAEVGAWVGPVESSYGVHFVFLHERQAPYTPALDELRDKLRAAIWEERERSALRSALEDMRAEAQIEIAERSE